LLLERPRELDLVIVDVFGVAALAGDDGWHMTLTPGAEDAAHPGMCDHGIGSFEVLEHLREAHERSCPRNALRWQAVPVLNDELGRRQRDQGFQQALERLVVRTYRDEDQRTLPS
jgi:hypothetical protein